MRDPEKLLGGDEDLGITCALIPSKTPGVVIGKRHDPLGVPFITVLLRAMMWWSMPRMPLLVELKCRQGLEDAYGISGGR